MQVNLPYLKCLVWFWVTSNPVYFVWGFRCPSWPATQNKDGIEKVDWSKNILSNDKKCKTFWNEPAYERNVSICSDRKDSNAHRTRAERPVIKVVSVVTNLRKVETHFFLKKTVFVGLSQSKLHQSFGICKKGLCIGYIPATVCPCLDCGVYRSCPYNSSALLLEGLNHHTVHC